MKIFAVGTNYAEHNKQTDGALYNTETPVVFTLPDSALLKDGKPLFVPDHLGRIDCEAEVVVRICRLGKSIPQRFARRYYDAVTLGVSFTARDVFSQARTKGLPWTLAKGFDGAAAIGDWVALEQLSDIQTLHFRLDSVTAKEQSQNLGSHTVQQGCTADMLHSVDQLISYISQFFTLKTGDLLYTGTPTVGRPVAIDDHLEGWLEGRRVLAMNCK